MLALLVLLVIFGAGASYDSDPYNRPDYNPNSRIEVLPPIEQHRPPLANRLFDHRPQFVDAMNQFSRCKPLIPHLRRAGVAVEQELARFQKEAEMYPEGHIQLAAVRYYLRRAVWECQNRWQSVHAGVTKYQTFLDEVERWRLQSKEKVCFVTFNYDLMLEDAMSQALHYQIDTMEHYHKGPNYSLFKLHGSVNWGRVVNGFKRNGRNSMSLVPNLLEGVRPERGAGVLGDYCLCDLDMNGRNGDDAVLYPALSIPLHQKDEFSCPDSHVTALEAILPHATKVITIGWRGAEEEFLRILKFSRQMPVAGIRAPMRLLVIANDAKGAEETTQNISTLAGNSPELFVPFHHVVMGFSGLVDSWAALRTFLQLGPA